MRSEAGVPPIRVLLVEDDEDDYVVTRDCLRSVGPRRFELMWVSTSEQALAALELGRQDVCLLDYRIGSTTGLELLQQARLKGWRGPFILLTGQGGGDVDLEAQRAGAADFLEKAQLTPTLLDRSIRYALQHARTLEALSRSQESFRELIERLPDGISVLQAERLVYINPAFVQLLGFSCPDEFIGKSLAELGRTYLQPEDWALLQEDLSRFGGTGTPAPPREAVLLRKGGGRVTAELAHVPMMFDGQPSLLWIVRDLTERKQMEARLLRADRMASLGLLAAGVAHEINNPLAYTLSSIDHLEDHVLPRLELASCDRDEIRGLLADTRLGACRVRDIVRQLKMFSRGDEEARLEPVDVQRVLETSIDMAAHEVKHRARLVRDYAEPLLAEAHEGRLGQVVLNLLINAAHAIPEGNVEKNEIHVVLRRQGMNVRIEVRDTGVGIPAAHLMRVFEPFFTTKPVGVGTGLGLSICHEIVTGFGGRMGVESREGVGTTFWILLNEVSLPKPAEAPRVDAPQAAPLRGRVLVVDDEPMIGTAIRRTLHREHEIVTLTSAREAFTRLLNGERYDVILCDLMMPEMSGVDLYQQLSHRLPELTERMVFLTGGAFTPSAREFLNQVSNRRMEKPFSSQDLRELVQTMLTRTAKAANA